MSIPIFRELDRNEGRESSYVSSVITSLLQLSAVISDDASR